MATHAGHQLLSPNPKSNLLRAMEAIADQPLVDGPQIRQSGDDQGDPFIVNPPWGYRQTSIAKVCPEHHCGSGHKPVLGQNNELASQQVLHAPSSKAKTLPQRPLLEAVLVIDDVGIREDQARSRMSHELLLRALETIGIPDVVLVTERDQIPGTEPNGFLKIPCGAQGLGVLDDDDREGHRGAKFAKDGDGLIRRPVVTYHQLIR